MMPTREEACAAIETYVDDHHDDAVEALKALVAVPSDNPPGDCAAHAERAAEWLAGLGLSRRAASGTRSARSGERDDLRDQSGGPRILRRRAGDRAQRPWRRGATGRRMDHGSLWWRNPGGLDDGPRRRHLKVGLRELHPCPPRPEVGGCAAQGRRRAPLHLRRGGGRRHRTRLAPGAGDLTARLCRLRRVLLQRGVSPQRLPPPRSGGARRLGPRRRTAHRPRRVAGGEPRFSPISTSPAPRAPNRSPPTPALPARRWWSG